MILSHEEADASDAVRQSVQGNDRFPKLSPRLIQRRLKTQILIRFTADLI